VRPQSFQRLSLTEDSLKDEGKRNHLGKGGTAGRKGREENKGLVRKDPKGALGHYKKPNGAPEEDAGPSEKLSVGKARTRGVPWERGEDSV